MKKDYTKFESLVDKFLKDAGYMSIGLQARDFMRPNPPILSSSSKLKDAIKIMLAQKIDAIPIVNSKNTIVGIINQKIALTELITSGDINKCIKNIIKRNPILTTPDASSIHLLKIPIKTIPVVENDRVTGIITLAETIQSTFGAALQLYGELKAIINSAHSGIVSIDKDGIVRIFNQAAERMLRLSSEDTLGKPLPEIGLNDKMMEVMKCGRMMCGEKLYIHDSKFFVNISSYKCEDEIVGTVAILQDISEMEGISEELRFTKELKSEMEAIIESSFDGIYLTDTHGKILRVNDAFSRITGISRAELINKTVRELTNAGIFRHPLPLHEILQGKSTTVSQEVRTGKIILVTSNPIFEQDIVVRIVHNVRDITELNNLKYELEHAETLSQHYQNQLELLRSPTKYIANSTKSKSLIELVLRLSKIDSTILLQGESGVGKDVIAEMLHENSERKDKLMITINCAAIPENLLESELFGYEHGAFTGSHKSGKIGAFELANGSTLFLDEIGELPLSLQPKLLRVLQKKEITKLGGNKTTKLDIRVIAATNRDLAAMVSAKSFRMDLYYRLNVIPITIPPLRERKEEIPDFVFHFVRIFNKKYKTNKRFDEKAIFEFLDYDWPGNIRELENVIERSIITSKDSLIKKAEFLNSQSSQPPMSKSAALPPEFNYKYALDNFDKELIRNALIRFGTTRRVAAELGVSQPTMELPPINRTPTPNLTAVF